MIDALHTHRPRIVVIGGGLLVYPLSSRIYVIVMLTLRRS